MSRTIDEIRREEFGYFFHYTGDGKVRFEWPSEYDIELNMLTVEKIEAYTRMHEEVWFGNVNRYDSDKGKPYLVQYKDQEMPRTFEYAFAIPCYDQKLVDLIIARDEAAYTCVPDDVPRVQEIMDRIHQLKGVNLFWV